MARPQKQTVDYYPHVAKCGKTIYILERKWGNDGYAVFHKIMETLCTTNGHVIDYGNPVEREFLVAKTLVSEETVTEIIEMLVKLGKFDAELWTEKKIWYQNFILSIADAYTKRTSKIPQKPVIVGENNNNDGFSVSETTEKKVSVGINPQTILEETKEENTLLSFDEFWKLYPKKKAKGDAEKAWKKIKIDAELVQKILDAIEQQKQSTQWQKDGGQFIPYPATWLNAKQWEDEPETIIGQEVDLSGWKIGQ